MRNNTLIDTVHLCSLRVPIVAAWEGHLSVAKFLYHSCGSAANVMNANGDTPLVVSSWEGHVHIVKFLLDIAPDVKDVRNLDGLSAHDVALSRGHIEVVNVLEGKVEKRFDSKEKSISTTKPVITIVPKTKHQLSKNNDTFHREVEASPSAHRIKFMAPLPGSELGHRDSSKEASPRNGTVSTKESKIISVATTKPIQEAETNKLKMPVKRWKMRAFRVALSKKNEEATKSQNNETLRKNLETQSCVELPVNGDTNGTRYNDSDPGQNNLEVASSMPLVGKRVRIHGTKKREINGCVGAVLRFDTSVLRYVVKLESGRTFQLKTGNLKDESITKVAPTKGQEGHIKDSSENVLKDSATQMLEPVSTVKIDISGANGEALQRTRKDAGDSQHRADAPENTATSAADAGKRKTEKPSFLIPPTPAQSAAAAAKRQAKSMGADKMTVEEARAKLSWPKEVTKTP